MSLPTDTEPTQPERPVDYSERDERALPAERNLPVKSEKPDFLGPIGKSIIARIRSIFSRSKAAEPIEKSTKIKQRKDRKVNKRNFKDGKLVGYVTITLLIMAPLSLFRSCGVQRSAKSDNSAVNSRVDQVEADVKQYGIASSFPMADASAKAVRFATECFTFENQRQEAQVARLETTGLPPEHCSWNGKGTSQVISAQVVEDSYWVKRSQATVIVQVKLYRRPGWFHLYVPFTSADGRIAKFAGMPSLFGIGTGPTEVLQECDTSAEGIDKEVALRQTAQEFLLSLTGDSDVDVRRLLAEGANFGDFSKTVHEPRLSSVSVCGQKGDELFFAGTVQFTGPGKGSQFTFPYAFSAVPSTNTDRLYDIKSFGPAPFLQER